MITLPSGRHVTVKNAAGLVKPGMWQRMRTGSATKGARDYHWAMIEITPDDTPEGHDDGHAFLLLRRHRYTGTVGVFARSVGETGLSGVVPGHHRQGRICRRPTRGSRSAQRSRDWT